MKHITYKLLILAVFFICHININAQRNVIWVHGLDGNASSWEHYNTIFDQERNINSLRQTYDTGFGIDYMANRVITSIDNYFAHKSHNPNNLAIGHSMGGVTIRDIDRITHNTGKRFGGYITVASPNYGAPIANSIEDGSVASAAQNAFQKIKDGPISERLMLPWGIWTIVTGLTTTKLGNIYINNDLMENIIGTPTTIEDLEQGSPTINAINYYTDHQNHTIPRISIWAQENSPVHWRLFSSASENYDNDTEFAEKVNVARAIYNGFATDNHTLGVINIFLDPAMAARYFFISRQWKKGRDWIDNSETIWCSLIKTTHQVQETYWVEVWVPDGPGKSVGNNSKPPDWEPPFGHWELQQRTRWVTVNDPSDGLLPKYTQIMKNNPTPNNTYRVYGANHIEVRDMTHDGNNVDETAVEFRKIFNRPEGDFFRTN